jgi:hypothetical protein
MKCHSQVLLALLGVALAVTTWPQRQALARTTQDQVGAAQEVDAEEAEYTEEEYEAYEKATKEPDTDKRAEMLMAYIDKYPESKLLPYIVNAMQTLLYEYQQGQKWEKLEPAAEKWLKYKPNELQTVGYIAESAQKLGHDAKYLEYALKIYEQRPAAGIAYHISQSYKKLGDDAKYTEWTLKLFSYPEFDGDFELRMIFVQRYADQKKYDKAAEYSQMALKSLEVAKKPDSVSEAKWREQTNAVRRACNYVIGVNHYEKERWTDAITSLMRALKAEKFDAAFYYIGLCQWKQNQVEDAMVSFAKAELLKGEMREQAKERLELLYKSVHNNTTIGIEKVYRKAQSELNERSAEAAGGR